jgi:hypothetical protein
VPTRPPLGNRRGPTITAVFALAALASSGTVLVLSRYPIGNGFVLNGLGATFSIWCSLAMALTRRWHGMPVSWRRGLAAAVLVVVAQPLAMWGTAAVLGFLLRGSGQAGLDAMVVVASALGGGAVALALRTATLRSWRPLVRAMVGWGVSWAFVMLPLSWACRSVSSKDGLFGPTGLWLLFSPGAVAFWQVPMAILIARWLVPFADVMTNHWSRGVGALRRHGGPPLTSVRLSRESSSR